MKLTDFQTGMLCTALFSAITFGGMYLVEGPTGEYVITDKQDGKIIYRDINNCNTHVMAFDADTAGIGFDVYSYVNVGDTITGHGRTMQKPVANPWYYRDGKLDIKTSAVRKINGIDIRTIQMHARAAAYANKKGRIK